MSSKRRSGDTEIMFLCIVNGVARWLPFPMVNYLVWTLHIGWVVPANFYRSPGRHKRGVFLDESGISGAELELAYEIHARRWTPVTQYTLEISQGALVTRRHRLGAIYPKAADPIVTVPTPGPDGKACEGYLLRRKITCIMVLATKDNDILFPWPLLLEPPKRRVPAVHLVTVDAREFVVLTHWTRRPPAGATGQQQASHLESALKIAAPEVR